MGLDAALIEIERACGTGSVLHDLDDLQRFSVDASETPAQLPKAVVLVHRAADVAAVMRAAHKHGVPVTPYAGGTSRVGGAVPVQGGIVIAFERMNGLKGVDEANSCATVEPGLITGELHRAVEPVGLFYPPDPNSLDSCTLGGNLATNAGGPRAFKYGVTRNYVMALNVVMPDGSELSLGAPTRKGVTGYDLTSLIVGSEGTLGVITEATLRLVARPERTATCLACFRDVQAIASAIAGLTRRRLVPACLELLDRVALDIVQRQAGLNVAAGTNAVLLLELDGPEATVERDLETVGNALLELGALDVLAASSTKERERIWSARRDLSHSLRKERAFKLSEDIVVPVSQMSSLLEACSRISESQRVLMPTYGHAGDGNLHVNFLWDTEDDRPRVQIAVQRLFEEVVARRGTLSGEHGIGVLKAPYLSIEQSPTLIALQERIKDLFDPTHIMNPGKIFPADAKRFHGAC